MNKAVHQLEFLRGETRMAMGAFIGHAHFFLRHARLLSSQPLAVEDALAIAIENIQIINDHLERKRISSVRASR